MWDWFEEIPSKSDRFINLWVFAFCVLLCRFLSKISWSSAFHHACASPSCTPAATNTGLGKSYRRWMHCICCPICCLSCWKGRTDTLMDDGVLVSALFSCILYMVDWLLQEGPLLPFHFSAHVDVTSHIHFLFHPYWLFALERGSWVGRHSLSNWEERKSCSPLAFSQPCTLTFSFVPL